MRFVKFTVEENEEYGGNGILPKIFGDWTNYLPSYGRTLAHDLLEHGTKETGGIDEEFAAIGSFLFVRDFNRMLAPSRYPTTIEKSMASGLPRQYEESTRPVRPAPKAYGLTK